MPPETKPATTNDYQLRRPSDRTRKPLPVPNAEDKILDAAEFIFGHFGLRGATTL